MKLPVGLREQASWVFIGLFITITGLSFALGLSQSAVTRAIGQDGLRAWGVFLVVTGVMVTVATWKAKPALEKMALRWLAFAMIAYSAWLLTVVPLRQTGVTIALAAILIGTAEIRVGYLKLLLASKVPRTGGAQDDDG